MARLPRGFQGQATQNTQVTRGFGNAQQGSLAQDLVAIRSEHRARRQKLIDQTYQADAEREFIRRVGEAQIEERKAISPTGEGFGQSLQGRYEKIREDIRKMAGREVNSEVVERTIGRLETSSVRQGVQDDRFEHERSVRYHTERLKDDIFDTARQAGNEDADLAQIVEAVEAKGLALLDASENDENLFRDTMRRARLEAVGAHVEGRIDREPFKVYQELKAGGFDHVLNDPSARNRLAAQALREHKRRQAEYERQQREVRARIKAEADDIEEALSIGSPVSDERILGLREIARGAGDDIIQGVEATIQIAQEAKEISGLSAKDGQDYVSDVRRASAQDGDASPVEVQRIKALDRAVKAKRTRINTDIVASGVSEGKIQPLDFDDFNLFAIPQRIAQAEAYARQNGKDAEYLTKDERDSLAIRIEDDLPLARDLARSKSGNLLLREVFPKNPDLVQLAQVSARGASLQFVEDAQLGFKLRKQKDYKPRVNSRLATESAASVIGSGMHVLPETEQAIIRNANAAYEARAQRQGLAGTQDDFDKKLYEELLSEAAGATKDARGRQVGGFASHRARGVKEKILLPPWMPAREFSKKFRGLTPQQVRRAAGGKGFTGDGAEIPPDSILRGMPVQDSLGRYAIRLGDVEDPEWVRNKDGGIYILDLNLLKHELID